MNCPNCDGILNVLGCGSCGWKHGDPWVSRESYKARAKYPPIPVDFSHPVRPLEPAPPELPPPPPEPVGTVPAAPGETPKPSGK